MALMNAWYFTEDATVWPYLGNDSLTHERYYGSPRVIKCGIEGEHKVSTDSNGQEFVVSTTFYTGDPCVKAMDRIERGICHGVPRGDEVRNVRRHGMAALGYEDEFTIEV